MSLGNTAESDLLLLILNNTNWAGVGDAGGLRGSVASGSFYVCLSTGALTGASTQSTTESTWTNYARVAVSRSAAGFTISGASPTQGANTGATTYPTCGVTGNTVTYFSLGRDAAGAGENLWYGPLTSPLIINSGITPSFAIGALVLQAS